MAGGTFVLHVVLCLRHPFQAAVDADHGEGRPTGRDRVEDLLEGFPRQVGGIDAVRVQLSHGGREFAGGLTLII